MALNEVFRHGDRVSLPVGVGVKSGQPVSVGDIVGWAQTDATPAKVDGVRPPGPSGSDINTSNNEGFASCSLVGAFKYPVRSTAALTVGQKVYISGTGKDAFLTTATDGKPFGHVIIGVATFDNTNGVAAVVRVQNGMNA